ncbi:MAG TPA: PAS domain S-box protein [Mycobacteriales bacterium]|nr:PAS domain S-box protein [Mycobacteriales bacterium]
MSDRAVLTRSCALDPVALSAWQAREFIRSVLVEAGRPEWAEAAEVAVSEIVTNAYLHAHTKLEVAARVEQDHVRVEVTDHNPTLPSRRTYEAEATTGRGMNVVAAVTSEHGVESLGAAGKVVWFCVSDAPAELMADDLLAQWDIDSLGDDPGSPGGEVTVELRGMPWRLWLAAREHHDALLREVALFRAEHPDDPAAQADLALADEARFLISGTLDRVLALAGGPAEPRPLQPAAEGHSPSLDLLVDVRPDQVRAFPAMQDALDEAERLAIADRLLAHPGLPEIVAVRDWACEQVIAQLHGAPASPWSGADDDRFTDQVNDRAASHVGDWDGSAVRSSLRSAVAADDANRIVAVSAPFCELLGWREDNLVGRRVVTLIPPRFREAHVVGFSRHLSTGEVNVIGQSLELPVLRGDGTEALCSFLIDHERSSGGRSYYVAWITPLVAEQREG